MKLRPDQIKNICFFRDEKSYKAFLEDKSSNKWSRVNEFYKWQLVRRSPSYIEFYDFTQYADEEIRTSETIEHWLLEPLIDPVIVHPKHEFKFHVTESFADIGRYTYDDFTSKNNSNKSTEKKILNSLMDLTYQSVEASGNKRFMLVAFDLEREMSSSDWKALKSKFEEAKSIYDQSDYSMSLKTNIRKSVIELEKSLFVYDYYIRQGSLSGIEKAFRNRFGIEASVDLTSLKDRLKTIGTYIENARDIKLHLREL